jgi:hypothetical protein
VNGIVAHEDGELLSARVISSNVVHNTSRRRHIDHGLLLKLLKALELSFKLREDIAHVTRLIKERRSPKGSHHVAKRESSCARLYLH